MELILFKLIGCHNGNKRAGESLRSFPQITSSHSLSPARNCTRALPLILESQKIKSSLLLKHFPSLFPKLPGLKLAACSHPSSHNQCSAQRSHSRFPFRAPKQFPETLSFLLCPRPFSGTFCFPRALKSAGPQCKYKCQQACAEYLIFPQRKLIFFSSPGRKALQ